MKTTTLFLCLLFLAGGSAFGNQTDPGGNSRNERRGPPPEAYQACQGKSAGSVSQFVDSRGETLKGTCEDENGRMVLRPYINRSDRQRQTQDGSGRNRIER